MGDTESKTLEKADTHTHTHTQERDTVGVKTVRDADFGKADAPSKKEYNGSQDLGKADTIQEGVQWESRPSGTGRHTMQDVVQWETRLSTRRGTHAIHDPRESGCTIQEGIQWEPGPSGRRTHHPRMGTMGVKTLGQADTTSKMEQLELRPWGELTHHPRRYTASQDP